MPRIVKDLPTRRADWSFGDLVYWHLFVYGSRPTSDPAAKAGRPWDSGAICQLLGISERTLRNWVFDRNLPDGVTALETELFGDNTGFDDARLELREALRTGRRRRSARSAAASIPDDGLAEPGDLPADPPDAEQPSTADASSTPQPPQDGARADRDEAQPAHTSGSDGAPNGKAHSGVRLPVLLSAARREEAGERPFVTANVRFTNQRSSSRWLSRALVPGLLVLIGGYAALSPRAPTPPRAPPPARTSGPPIVESRRDDPPSRPETRPIDKPPSSETLPADESRTGRTDPITQPDPGEQRRREEAARAAEEQRVVQLTIEANKAAFDAERRAREQEARRRDAEAEVAARAQRDREWNARQVAGMGYRLLENTGANGTSVGYVLADSVTECALACLRDGCDGFAFQKEPAGPRGISKLGTIQRTWLPAEAPRRHLPRGWTVTMAGSSIDVLFTAAAASCLAASSSTTPA